MASAAAAVLANAPSSISAITLKTGFSGKCDGIFSFLNGYFYSYFFQDLSTRCQSRTLSPFFHFIKCNPAKESNGSAGGVRPGNYENKGEVIFHILDFLTMG